MPDEIKVADVKEIPEHGQSKILEVQGMEIGIFNLDGDYFAIANHCSHQGGPLCEGEISNSFGLDEKGELIYDKRDRVIKCPWHAWPFDIATGQSTLTDSLSAPTFETKVADGKVYVVL